MGHCYSCLLACCGKQDNRSQFGDVSDREQLIDDHNGSAENIPTNFYGDYQSRDYLKEDEENQDLQKIMETMATNVIDVGTRGAHSLEQYESRERTNYYMNKMRTITGSRPLGKLPKPCLLEDVPNPEKIFNKSCCIHDDELSNITNVLNEIDHLLNNMKLKDKDDLIIEFQVQL